MNTFDLIVLAVIAASALFAFLRGFVREALGILAWLGAAAAAMYLYEPLQPLFARIITAPWLVLIVEPIVIFLVFLILLSYLTGMMSSRVRRSGFGPLDRGLGLLFGLARGILVVCIVVIALDYYLPVSSRPAWIKDARTLPMIETGADQLKSVIPPDMLQRGTDAAESTIDRVDRARRIQRDLNALHSDTTGDATNSTLYDRKSDDKNAQAGGTPSSSPHHPSGDYSTDQQQGLDQAILQATETPSTSGQPHKGHTTQASPSYPQ